MRNQNFWQTENNQNGKYEAAKRDASSGEGGRRGARENEGSQTKAQRGAAAKWVGGLNRIGSLRNTKTRIKAGWNGVVRSSNSRAALFPCTQYTANAEKKERKENRSPGKVNENMYRNIYNRVCTSLSSVKTENAEIEKRKASQAVNTEKAKRWGENTKG